MYMKNHMIGQTFKKTHIHILRILVWRLASALARRLESWKPSNHLKFKWASPSVYGLKAFKCFKCAVKTFKSFKVQMWPLVSSMKA